jgi:hypothetical protein
VRPASRIVVLSVAAKLERRVVVIESPLANLFEVCADLS